jgi:hypothetical protein
MPLTSLPSSDSTEFYARRGDRTARCLDGRLPPLFHAVISIANGWEHNASTLACVETLGNLLVRFCSCVTIVATDVQAALIEATKTLAMMKGADPFGEFDTTGTFPTHDVEIRIGGGTTEERTQIALSFDGWIARVSGQPTAAQPCPSADTNHAPGAELAACLAGAATFRFWNERTTTGVNPFELDLRNLNGASSGPTTSPVWVNPRPLTLLMVGAGSVGSATSYFLPRLGFRGHVDVLDHDMVEIENLDRSPIFVAQHDREPKANVVTEHLRTKNVSATAFPCTWNEFVQKNPGLMRKHDAWLALANEHGVRRSMQANYPPVTIQASTGRNWGVQFGRHIPFVDDCQLDRFPEEPAGPLKCADGPVKAASCKLVDAALPFSSFTAGLFVAAAVARMAIGELNRGPNMCLLSFEPKFDLLTMDRRPAERCLCRKASRPIWERIWHASGPA